MSTQQHDPSMVSLEHVTKRFGHRLAVNDVSLEVPKGTIYGLLGHNGAGKSSIIGMLLGQVLPDAGKLLINGHEVFSHRRQALARVGAIFETPAFYNHLSGEKNLRIFCEYTGRANPKRIAEVAEIVGLSQRIGDPVEVYSHGMRQRLALAQALLPVPSLLILDEPTEGLDPEGIIEIRDLIRKLHSEWGITILASSHLLSEMEQLCSHLAILREGELLYSGEWREELSAQKRIRLQTGRQSDAEAGLRHAGLIASAAPGGIRLIGNYNISDVAEWLVTAGFRIEELAQDNMSLEDFYLETTRKSRTAGNK